MATSDTKMLLNVYIYLTIFLAILCQWASSGPPNKTSYFGNAPQPKIDDNTARFKDVIEKLERQLEKDVDTRNTPPPDHLLLPVVRPLVQENGNRNHPDQGILKEVNQHRLQLDLSAKSQQFINLNKDIRFDLAASEICEDTLEKLPECNKLPHGKGQVIPCLIYHQRNVSDNNCKLFLRKISYIIFGDNRLIYKLVEKCQADIERQGCGRVTRTDQSAKHSQGETIECLSFNINRLNKYCKHEILRFAELQADDYQMDRPLFFACREDREAFCDGVENEGGKVYTCLYKHKFQKGMSSQCQHQLVRRQKMIQEDYKIHKTFASRCNNDIERQRCLGDDATKYDKSRLSHVLLCLQSASKEGVVLQPECTREMKGIRRSLMEDILISPDILKGCSSELKQYCGNLSRPGKTLHCLMNLARPQIQDEKDGKGHNRLGRKASPRCQGALEVLLKEVDVGEDYRVDPVLAEACKPAINIACSDISREEEVIGCLLEHIDTDKMQEECQNHLLELQYFISRKFELDPALYKHCHSDATSLCSAPKTWDNARPEKRKQLIFKCLFNHLKRQSTDPKKQLTRGCSFEVKRVLRQRAVRLELQPRIQEPCMLDLGQLCSERTNIGEEIDCLQMNFEALSRDCKDAIRNYTEDTEVYPELDRMLMKRCTPMIKVFCKIKDHCIEHIPVGEGSEFDHSGLVEDCLKRALAGGKITKPSCQKEVARLLAEGLADVRVDPLLYRACALDIKYYCVDVPPGKGKHMMCLLSTLEDPKCKLTHKCHQMLVDRKNNWEYAALLRSASDRREATDKC